MNRGLAGSGEPLARTICNDISTERVEGESSQYLHLSSPHLYCILSI